MSRLEELIAEFCPNGVEYETLEFCTKKVSNIKWKKEINSFQYIDLSSVDRETHKISNTSEINRDNAPSRAQQIVNEGDILFGSTRPLLNRYCQINEEYDNAICSTGFCVLRPDTSKVHKRWIYHFLSSRSFIDHVKAYQQGASYPTISDADLKSYRIPVPPLPIQEEIVRMLDNFTELTGELTAELTKRNQQYQYYRDFLLTFDASQPTSQTDRRRVLVGFSEIRTLCYTVTAPKKIVKSEYRDTGKYPIIDQGHNFIAGYTNEKSYVLNDSEYIIFGDHTREIKYVNFPFAQGADGIKIIKTNERILPKFLFYVMNNLQIPNRGYNRHWQIVSSMTVPVPSLEEQARIVAILDRFDALCNDLTCGLPAEIEARKKQYEYYRDKLLTFKEAVQ